MPWHWYTVLLRAEVHMCVKLIHLQYNFSLFLFCDICLWSSEWARNQTPLNEAASSLNLLQWTAFKRKQEIGNTAAADNTGDQICLNTAGNSVGEEDSALKYFFSQRQELQNFPNKLNPAGWRALCTNFQERLQYVLMLLLLLTASVSALCFLCQKCYSFAGQIGKW